MVRNSSSVFQRRSRRRARLAAAVLGICGTGAALADETEARLKEMKVSAESNKPVQLRTELGRLTEYTPISGAVVSAEQLDHLQLGNNLLELGKRVPGIAMIRNMRFPDGGKLYTENRIDGMRATATNTSVLDEIDTADIERIEVITGPASALYGSGAFGGTISVFTRQPPQDFRARLSQEFGSWGLQRTKAYAGTSFADGRIGFIVTGSTLDNDGWRKNTAPGANDAAAEHKDGLSLRTLLRPTDSTRLTLGYSRLDYDYRWAGPIPLNAAEAAKLKNVAVNGTNLRSVHLENDWQQVVPGSYGQYIDRYATTSLRLQQLVGERGELSLAHTRITDDGINNGNGGSGGANNVICDWTGAATPGKVRCQDVNFGAPSITNTIKKSAIVTRTTLAMYRQEFDLAQTTAYVGAEAVDVASDSTTYNNSYSALQAQAGMWAQGSMTASGQGSLTNTRESTPFVHVEFSPLDRLRLHLGQRFGKIDYAVDDRTAANKDVTMTRRGDVLRLGATYELNRSHLVWANYGETFNPQSTSSLIDSFAVPTVNNVIGQALAPERGVTREIGLRGRFAELGLHYDLTYYDAQSEGFIITRNCSAAEQTLYNGGLACTINDAAGKAAARGVESMFNWNINSWLDLGATYTWQRVWFPDYKTTTFDYSGKTYQAAPKHKLNLRLGVKPAPGWLVELEADHISDYYVDNTNDNGSYQRPDLLSLRASYRSKQWSLWLHAINLTDREYATRVQLSTVGGVRNVLAAQASQGNAGSYTPLTLRAGVSYAF